MDGFKVLSENYADSMVLSIRKRGITDEIILSLIREIAYRSFITGASSAMGIASDVMNQYYKSIQEGTDGYKPETKEEKK